MGRCSNASIDSNLTNVVLRLLWFVQKSPPLEPRKYQSSITCEPMPDDRSKTPRQISPEQYQRLKAEIVAPYRTLRQFVYVACGASGFIGALVFLGQLAAGREVNSAIPNLALQVGVVALMVWLFRLEQRSRRSSKSK